MTDTVWNPAQYLVYEDARSRPFVELLARVPAQNPTTVVDLGCGPGNGEAHLQRIWPAAHLIGVDSSQEMIDQAIVRSQNPQAEYIRQDVRQWIIDAENLRPDVIVSNAMFQWVEGHLDFLPQLADTVADQGVFAFQVPANFDQPSHVILRELAAEQPYAQFVTEKLRDRVIRADEYYEVLDRPGWSIDAWETTYFHELEGENPVFDWISATGARPVLNALPEPLKTQFIDEYKKRLSLAYPVKTLGTGAQGTILKFLRVFLVARKINRES